MTKARIHVLVAELRRCLDDQKYQTARRKLDAIDAVAAVLEPKSRADTEGNPPTPPQEKP
jgi:hypothetical protein